MISLNGPAGILTPPDRARGSPDRCRDRACSIRRNAGARAPAALRRHILDETLPLGLGRHDAPGRKRRQRCMASWLAARDRREQDQPVDQRGMGGREQARGHRSPGVRYQRHPVGGPGAENEADRGLQLSCRIRRDAERRIVSGRPPHLRIAIGCPKPWKSRPQTSKPASLSASRHDRPSKRCAMESAEGNVAPWT